jgi:hypothetical protein
VFVAPTQAKQTAEIARFDVRAGAAEWTVANSGNVHLRPERVALVGVARDGTQLFAQEFPERYFLAGVTKTLRFDIPRETCRQLVTMEASVVGENLDLKRKLDVDPGNCR